MTSNHQRGIAILTAFLMLNTACGGSSDTKGTGSTSSGSGGDGGGGGGGGSWPSFEVADPPTTLTTPSDGTPITSASKNHQWICPRPGIAPKLTAASTPWVKGTTIDISKIELIQGSVSWDSQFSITMTDTDRTMTGNGLPNHPTGTFPIPKGSPGYDYYAALPAQGYDNAAEIPIKAYDINLTIPRDPVPNAQPSCILWIFLGMASQTGSAWHAEIAPDAKLNYYNPISALPLDECWGHPYNGQYHYHAYSWKCFPNQGSSGDHSPLFGYAIDGFGIYGPRGENGKLVTNDDLDECHGHTHEIEWDGVTKVMYHYHVNNEYPYTLGCYRGTPIALPKELQN